MHLDSFIRQMPKVELHVHLEGAVQPATLLALARQNRVTLPADTEDGIRKWYTFTDFDHFVEIYRQISACIRSADDLELIAREFLRGQAAQNILYSEVIFTPYLRASQKGLSFPEQLAALNRAIAWARETFSVDMGIVPDISRETTLEAGLVVAEWAIGAMGDGVIALGLGGPEVGNPPEKHRAAFKRAHEAGLPSLPHAGETDGPASIRGALDTLYPNRILHGVRCLEDDALVERLRAMQIPLDVCPTSNICLNVFPSMEAHPLPRLLDAGLFVTINSDDPPMFNTTLTDEYLTIARVFGYRAAQLKQFVMNGVHASLLPTAVKSTLTARIEAGFELLMSQLQEA